MFVLGLLFSVLTFSSFPSYAQNSESNPVLVDEKYSLKKDREAFEQLRKEIPANVRAENDEKALMDNLMSDLNVPPSEVRSRFSSLLSKKRDTFQKDMTKKREEFSGTLTKEREAFSEDQSQKRKVLSGRKMTSEEKSSAYEQLENRRKDFYSRQQERRDEFEDQVREQRKNFEDYVKSKQDEFNQRHTDYTVRYQENIKNMADVKKQKAEAAKKMQQSLDQEYEGVQKKTAVPLYVEEPGK